MKRPPKQVILNRAEVQQARLTDPVHPLPGAQPIGSVVTLMLERAPAQPEIIIHDRTHDVTWHVVMEPGAQPESWQATLRLPSQQTILSYWFRFPDGTSFLALRQEEGLIPGTPDPIYGQWTRRPFHLTVYDPDSMPPEHWRGRVIYQIFPDRFHRSPHAHTGKRVAKKVHGRQPLFLEWDALPEIPAKGRDFFSGNLRGITEKLDYLADLGIDCIYMTPIFESPSNHRYDAMDYFRIDPLLGSESDLAELVDETHKRGMQIVLDAVCNHCSNDSRYFNQAGWYGADEGAYRSRSSPYFRMFSFKKYPKGYIGWVGVRSMPEFVECPEHEALFLGPEGIIPYWMRLNIDGWRTDVTPWMTDTFWRRFRRAVHAIKPDAFLVAEEWNDASHYLTGDMFDATMNYRFGKAVRGFFAQDGLTAEEMAERLDVLRHDTPPPALLVQVNVITSHDTARLLTLCGGDVRRVQQIMAFLFAYPGAPMLYYGEEIGLEGAFAEDGRRPFLWEGGDKALQQFVRTLLHLRRAHPALRLGDFTALHAADDTCTYAFSRTLGDTTIIAAFNASDQAQTLALVNTADGIWSDLLGQNQAASGESGVLHIRLAPRSMGWFVREG